MNAPTADSAPEREGEQTEQKWTITMFSAPTLKKGARENGEKRTGEYATEVWWSPYDREAGKPAPIKGKLAHLTLEKLAILLGEPRPDKGGKFLVPYYIGGTIPSLVRDEPTVMSSCSLLSVDVDAVATIDEACERFGAYSYFLYTTANHRPEAQRFRLVFPLARDCTPEEYSRLWWWAARQLPAGAADENAKDPTRVCLLPINRGFFRFLDESSGPLLNPDTILAQIKPEDVPTAKGKAGAGPKGSLKVHDILAGVPSGQRDTTLFRYACRLRGQGVQQQEALALVLVAASKCQPPFDATEAAAKVERVWRIYAGKDDAEGSGASEALRTLEAIVVEIEGAGKREERLRRLAAALADQTTFDLLRVADAREPRAIDALLLRIEAMNGLASKTKPIRKELRKWRKEAYRSRASEGEPLDDDLRRSLTSRGRLADDLRLPPSWRMDPGGLWLLKEGFDADGDPTVKEEKVAHNPVILTGRLTDIQTGALFLRLSWQLEDGSWEDTVLPREKALNARYLAEAARWGAPVDSNTASNLVKFISDFEAANVGVLPQASATTHMGWQGDGGHLGFLWGERLLLPGGHPADLVHDRADGQGWADGGIQLVLDGVDGGNGLVDACHASGSWVQWKKLWKAADPYPYLQLAVYASIASAVLRLLREAPCFTFSFAGMTGGGKTTAQLFASSCWGRADEEGGACWGSWAGTKYGAEQRAALLHDMPLILDDTKKCKDPTGQQVPDTVFLHSQGRGAERGKAGGGTQQVGTWKSVMISSSETPLSSFGSSPGGAAARTVELWGFPLLEKSKEMAKLSEWFREGLKDSYGHLGPRIVQWLLNNAEGRTIVQAYYDEAKTRWREAGNENAARAAQYLAALETAGMLLKDVADLDTDPKALVQVAFAQVLANSGETDRATLALRAVFSWAASRQAAFFGRNEAHSDGSDRSPPGGWLGKWENLEHWNELAVLEGPLKQQLLTEKYDWKAMIDTWIQRDWVVREKDKRTTRRWIEGVHAPCIVLRRTAIDAAIDG